MCPCHVWDFACDGWCLKWDSISSYRPYAQQWFDLLRTVSHLLSSWTAGCKWECSICFLYIDRFLSKIKSLLGIVNMRSKELKRGEKGSNVLAPFTFSIQYVCVIVFSYCFTPSDFCYGNEDLTFSISEAIKLCVTVVAYAPESFRRC